MLHHSATALRLLSTCFHNAMSIRDLFGVLYYLLETIAHLFSAKNLDSRCTAICAGRSDGEETRLPRIQPGNLP